MRTSKPLLLASVLVFFETPKIFAQQIDSLVYFLNNPRFETVRILADDAGNTRGATGFVCERGGRQIVVTASHVTIGTSNIVAQFRDNWSPQKLHLIGLSVQEDISFLTLTRPRNNTPSCNDIWGNPDSLQGGEEVAFLVAPERDSQKEFGYVRGWIRAKSEYVVPNQTESRSLLIQTAGYLGTSGSAVINRSGKVIGVITSILEERHTICLEDKPIEDCSKTLILKVKLPYSMALRTDDLLKVMDKVFASVVEPLGVRHSLVLGVRVGICNESFDICSSGAVVVRGINDSSAAYRAGLRFNDAIVGVDSIPINSLPDYFTAVMFLNPGDAVTLTVSRLETNGLYREFLIPVIVEDISLYPDSPKKTPKK